MIILKSKVYYSVEHSYIYLKYFIKTDRDPHKLYTWNTFFLPLNTCIQFKDWVFTCQCKIQRSFVLPSFVKFEACWIQGMPVPQGRFTGWRCVTCDHMWYQHCAILYKAQDVSLWCIIFYMFIGSKDVTAHLKLIIQYYFWVFTYLFCSLKRRLNKSVSRILFFNLGKTVFFSEAEHQKSL